MTANESFEQEIKAYFRQKKIKFSDSSASYDQLDFSILKNDKPVFYFDAKEKRQNYNLNNWPKIVSQQDSLILDDLAIRKCLAFAPQSGILVRDNLRMKYFFFSILDLALMPRLRANRAIDRNQVGIKGKWLIDLRNGKQAQSVEDAIDEIRGYMQNLKTYLYKILECYGSYVGENIEQGGIVRQPTHWDTDVQSTR